MKRTYHATLSVPVEIVDTEGTFDMDRIHEEVMKLAKNSSIAAKLPYVVGDPLVSFGKVVVHQPAKERLQGETDPNEAMVPIGIRRRITKPAPEITE